MRQFFRILRLGKPYRRYAILNGVFNLLATVFHLCSMLLLIPFLQLLMNQADAVFIFKIFSALTTASSSTVSFLNGGDGAGVFWQVGSAATLGTASVFAGSLLADQSITINAGASILCGRAIALHAAVTLNNNTLSHACTEEVGGGTTLPEPSVLSLLALAGLGLAIIRQRPRQCTGQSTHQSSRLRSL